MRISKGRVLLRLELGPHFLKISYIAQIKLRGNITFNTSTFKLKTLNTINQLPELRTSAANKNIDIICVQEHRY